ncbi:hypothetical protein AOQ84DRAFT_49647 [Glonium stellatum]|uniref:Uncharacterized protein n=1 Tax=Glonium stellatum TaxID=574774 RepID=A0A8E2F0P9_9PEZI|nr:hypothetical protein AOQ84DRAFT_49647 [Glonium stellatum]
MRCHALQCDVDTMRRAVGQSDAQVFQRRKRKKISSLVRFQARCGVGVGTWILDTGCRIPDAGYQVPDTKCRILDVGY